MKTKRNHEGYLLIQHDSQSPGVSDAAMVRQGLPVGSGHGAFEAPTFTCSHCQKIQIVNPLRTRERAYCAKCDHYLCDECGIVMKLHGNCRPFSKVADETLERASRGQPIEIFTRT